MKPTPIKPTDTLYRLSRGGSWYSTSATVVRAACRGDGSPSLRGDYVGFRCAQRGARMPLKATP